jgi:hypothetical protein
MGQPQDEKIFAVERIVLPKIGRSDQRDEVTKDVAYCGSEQGQDDNYNESNHYHNQGVLK